MTPLPRSFFASAADVVARQLLGHWLLRDTPGGWVGGPIVETEAYLSRGDPSMGAYQAETPRNGVLFGPPGHAFIYRVYRIHLLLNFSCREPGVAEAVLVRAIEPARGEEWMRQRRPVLRARDLTNGPSKLCQALALSRDLNGADACAPHAPIVLARNTQWEAFRASRGPIVTTTRIGLKQGGDLPLRWYLSGSECVSKRERRSKGAGA